MNTMLRGYDTEFVASQPLRVLHAIGSISLARGGSSVAVLNTVAALATAGVASELVTTDDDGPDRRRADVAFGRLQEDPACAAWFFPRQTLFYSASWPMLPWLLDNVDRYDVIHVHGLFNFAPGAAALAAAMRRVPFVVQPHGVLERWGREQRRPWVKRNSIRFIEGPLLRRAGAVLFTSAQELEQAAGLPLPQRRAVIPLAMSAIAAATGSPWSHVDERFKSLAQRPWALFLGRLDPKKGVERLLTAFAAVRRRLPDAALVVAGEGSPEYVAALQHQARDLQIADSILWPGFVTGAAKDWLLRHCGVFALASSSENFCLAAVEAMAAGRPVVLSSGVAVADIVRRHHAGFVTGLDPGEIADRLCAALGDSATADAMGCRGRAAVLAELSPQVHGARLDALYREVIAGQRRTAPTSGQRGVSV